MLTTNIDNAYLDYHRTKGYLGLNNKDWSRHHRMLPWLMINGLRCCSLINLQDIKQKIDPYYYLGEAQIILETGLYYILFKRRVKDLNIPSFKHPFHSRMLYRTVDIPLIKRGRHE